MSTTRDRKNGFNRKRATNLVRARRERALNRSRTTHEYGVETYDLEHDAQREVDLIDGTWAEQEAAQDGSYKF